jgi:Ser/Thr protein kinase RdoA (MazF antagonist)
MPVFPTQYSTLSAIALNDHLQKRYNLKDTQCKLLIRNVSDTYVLEDTSSKYIFKIYRDAHRKIDEIKGEIELLTLLQEQGAKVSYPIADRDGQMLQQFEAAEGIRYGVLFTWAQGEVVYAMTNDQLNLLGKEMAVVHNISSTIKLNYYRNPYTAETTILQPLKTFEPAFADLQEEYNYLKNTGEAVVKRMAHYSLDNFSYGYCHYDFLPKNFHFSENGNITFFDFDFAGGGMLANDITTFLIHYFLEVTYGKIKLEEGRLAFKTFFDSYSKVRSVTHEEIQAIPNLGFAFWVFYLGFQYENYDDWSNAFFGPKFIKDRVALIKKWMETAYEFLPD